MSTICATIGADRPWVIYMWSPILTKNKILIQKDNFLLVRLRHDTIVS